MCGSSLHMSKGEIKLLCYYAARSNGFKPSAKLISKETGLSRARVFAGRQMLEEHGVISVDNERVYIDWQRIRIFASLDPKMTSKHCRIAPIAKKRDYTIYYPPKSFMIKLNSCSTEDACKMLSALTEDEYRRVRCRIMQEAG